MKNREITTYVFARINNSGLYNNEIFYFHSGIINVSFYDIFLSYLPTYSLFKESISLVSFMPMLHFAVGLLLIVSTINKRYVKIQTTFRGGGGGEAEGRGRALI